MAGGRRAALPARRRGRASRPSCSRSASACSPPARSARSPPRRRRRSATGSCRSTTRLFIDGRLRDDGTRTVLTSAEALRVRRRAAARHPRADRRGRADDRRRPRRDPAPVRAGAGSRRAHARGDRAAAAAGVVALPPLHPATGGRPGRGADLRALPVRRRADPRAPGAGGERSRRRRVRAPVDGRGRAGRRLRPRGGGAPGLLRRDRGVPRREPPAAPVRARRHALSPRARRGRRRLDRLVEPRPRARRAARGVRRAGARGRRPLPRLWHGRPGRARAEPAPVPVGGSYVVRWSAIADPGAVYALEEAGRRDWSDAREIHRGPDLSLQLLGRAPGVYYYRVRALVGERLERLLAGHRRARPARGALGARARRRLRARRAASRCSAR